MEFEFSNINTQYTNVTTDIVSTIKKENTDSSKSDVSSAYDSKSMNLDAAVLSLSDRGTAKINAMMNKSIMLRASAANPNLSRAERQKVSSELDAIHKEIGEIRNEEDANVMLEKCTKNILADANDSIKTQASTKELVLHLL